jgi:2-dehydro-3-deoxygluconokinase
MTQSTQSQQQQERKFIAVDFRGVQQMTRERTALTIVGPAELDIIGDLTGPLPDLEELEEDGSPLRPPLSASAGLALGLGGEGARAAYAYAAHGGMARLASTVGADPAGEIVLRWLSDQGVDVGLVARRGRTPITLLLAAPGRRALALFQADAAAASDGALELDQALAGNQRMVMLAGYPYVGRLRGEGAVALLQRARQRQLRTVVSLSPVLLGGPEAPLTPADLELLLPHVDLICGGEAELRRATRRADPQEAARALIHQGARAVLAKRGIHGAAVFRPGPTGLEREDTPVPLAEAARITASPLHLAAAFGAVFDAAYLLGVALNDVSPVRFAVAAAVRAATSGRGVLAL